MSSLFSIVGQYPDSLSTIGVSKGSGSVFRKVKVVSQGSG